MFPRDSQPLLKSEKFMVLSNLSAKKLPKLFNYFDDCYRTSGSLFSPLFMKGKNMWGSKRKKKEGESISWYKESQPITRVNTQLLLTPLWFSALCHSIMRKAESDPRCIFTSPLQKCFKAGNDFFHPSRNLPDLGTHLASWVGVARCHASVVISVQHSQTLESRVTITEWPWYSYWKTDCLASSSPEFPVFQGSEIEQFLSSLHWEPKRDRCLSFLLIS